jgi:hypothetical protein
VSRSGAGRGDHRNPNARPAHKPESGHHPR